MAGDLERFLQQAAEQLARKVSESQRPAGSRRTSPQSSPQAGQNRGAGRSNNPQPGRGNVRRAERLPPQAEVIEANVIGPINPEDEHGPDPLSDLDTRHLDPSVLHRPKFAGGIDQADERMSEHVRHVIDHDIVDLRDASRALGRHSDSSRVEKRTLHSNPLIEMLRHKDSLKSAFIASEIFRRKFD